MRLFRHPVHPMLVAFPIALLGLTPVWDLLASLGVLAGVASVGYFGEVAGLILGGLAAVPGLVDLVKIPAGQPAAVRSALIHASLAVGSLSLFGVALVMRGGRTLAPGAAPLALEIVGALGLAATGWFGGHLVFHHRVGVDPAASDRGDA